jgi:hypothetical protein
MGRGGHFLLSGGLAASKLVGEVRLVDVMKLFGAGFAPGAGLVDAIIRRRQSRGPN